MSSSPTLRRLSVRVGATAVAVATLAACSSSGSGGGGSAPSQSQILNKLKSDSTVTSSFGQFSSASPKLKNEALSCIAKVIHDDVDASDARAYVDGSKSIKDIGQGSSNKQMTSDLQSCITSKIKSG